MGSTHKFVQPRVPWFHQIINTVDQSKNTKNLRKNFADQVGEKIGIKFLYSFLDGSGFVTNAICIVRFDILKIKIKQYFDYN